MDQVVHVANCSLIWHLSFWLIVAIVCVENIREAGDKGTSGGADKKQR
jgi:hypothetical protein